MLAGVVGAWPMRAVPVTKQRRARPPFCVGTVLGMVVGSPGKEITSAGRGIRPCLCPELAVTSAVAPREADGAR